MKQNLKCNTFTIYNKCDAVNISILKQPTFAIKALVIEEDSVS